jgi:glycosyltransferase involved in cell wall biosynthesis
LRERRIDILHAHKFGSNAWAALWSTVARPPVLIAHEQTWSFEGKPARRWIDRELIAKRADAFICVSSEDRRRMIEIERIDPDKIVLVPNGIPPLVAGANDNVRAELSIAAEAPVVGTVSVLRDQKALDILLRAATIVRERIPDVQILIAGDGPEREPLERLSSGLGLDASVRFLGSRSDVPALLGAFDVAALSSDYEGTPLAVMEYMAAGLPIVATRVGGVPELIEDGRSGVLVDRRSPEQLAAGLVRLIKDRDLAAQLGIAARERQRDEFSIASVSKRVESLYERLYTAARSPF